MFGKNLNPRLIRELRRDFKHFFGVIALVSLSVCLSVFKYLRDLSLVFPEILHEVGGQ